MAEFRIDTGWSVFDISLSDGSVAAGRSYDYGSKDTLLTVSVSNSGRILYMGLIYVDRIWQENTRLPAWNTRNRRFSPDGPSGEEQLFREPMWVNLHPEKRELEMIFLPAPYANIRSHSCFREDRVEIYYADYTIYDEELDCQVPQIRLAIIRVTDLTEEEYTYLKRFV